MSLAAVLRSRGRWRTRLAVALAVVIVYVFFGRGDWRPSLRGGGGRGGRQATSNLTLGRHGIASGWADGDTLHPIEKLMEHGRQRWDMLLASQTLEEAVAEYKRRYQRLPPKGFDKWWQFAVEHDVKIKDDIHKDTHIFHGISPAMFRERFQEQTEKNLFSYEIKFDPHGETVRAGHKPDDFRAVDMQKLVSGFASLLPARTHMIVSAHDLGSMMPGHDQRLFLEDKIRRGEYATADELRPFENANRPNPDGVRGIASVCPTSSPGWIEARDRGPKPHLRPIAVPADQDHPNFIWDLRDALDFCYDTSLLLFHGELSYDISRNTKLQPVFQQSKYDRNGEFVLTPLDWYRNATDADSVAAYKPWAQKGQAKMHWRGRMTGDHYDKRKDYNWRNSHRIRLHMKTHETEGESNILVQEGDGKWHVQSWSNAALNKAYMDVGLTNQPQQEDGTCDDLSAAIQFADRVGAKEAADFKYAIDVDGNGWSARHHRLLISGAAIFKSTILPEWNTDWLIPWYHFVVSYAELYTTLAFFIGQPGTFRNDHDDLAQQIGENGRDFALNYWRWEDMQSYMFRLLLEYIRLEQDNRDEWVFDLPS